MLAMKFIGKPYAGKSHVRIDEGAGRGLWPLPLYSTVLVAKEVIFMSMQLRT
jgi:hypothetical protein